MAVYQYKARDKAGVATTASMEADSSEVVTELLRKKGLQVVYIQESRGLLVLLEALSRRFRRSSRPREVVSFTRQLALLVRAGIPLVDGIESLSEQPFSPAFKETLKVLGEDLRRGKSFSEGLSRHPAAFSNFAVSMIKSAETAGILDEVLERLASIAEGEQELKGQVSTALTYPILLVFLALGVVTFLLTGVLPGVVGIFEESGILLPLSTRILLGISAFLQKFGFLLPIFIGAAIFLAVRYYRTPAGRIRVDGLFLRLPFFGNLLKLTIFARSFKALASLLKSGIAAVPALEVMEELVGNRVVARSILRIRQGVIGGTSLSEPFRSEKIFPPTVVQLVAVGERTGTLDESFLHLGDYYEQEVERSLKVMTSLLEPLLLLVMGLLVAFIALSVLLPIFQLVRVFQR